MPMTVRAMTDKEVRAIKHDVSYKNKIIAVGGAKGLALQLSRAKQRAPDGTLEDVVHRSWLMRYSFEGERRAMGLGPYPEVSLAKARDRANDIRAQVRAGVDPVGESRRTKRAAKAQARAETLGSKTFRDLVDAYEAGGMLNSLKGRHAKKSELSLMSNWAYPHIGSTPVADITKHDIYKVMMQPDPRSGMPLRTHHKSTASRLKTRLKLLFDWAKANDWVAGENPVLIVNAMLPKPEVAEKKSAAVQYAEAPLWWSQLATVALTPAEMQALPLVKFLALTAVRRGQAQAMTFDQVDWDAAVWTCPAKNTKTGGTDHHVPLSRQALALLKEQRAKTNGELVFPALRGGVISGTLLTNILEQRNVKPDGKPFVDKDSKAKVTVHGLRSTFRDWASEETDHGSDLAELALDHAVGGKVERAYKRGQKVDKRRALMQDWADYLDGHTL